jgi:tRNA-dihydrouridine synthase
LNGESFQERYPSTKDQIRGHISLLLKQLDNTIEWYGEERGCIEFRSHFSWYLKRFKLRREFRDGLYSLSSKEGTVEKVREIEKAWLGQADMTKF